MNRIVLWAVLAIAGLTLFCWTFDSQYLKGKAAEPIEINWVNFYTMCIIFSMVFSIFNRSKS